MTFGFIIIRHVNSAITNEYWKECYTCIRRFYDNPIVIIDDSSNKDYLVEDLPLKNATVIYDHQHKGAAELIPYYYFHQFHPFDTAIILHDSVFLKQHINVECTSVKYIWTFPHYWDDEIFHIIGPQLSKLPHASSLLDLYKEKNDWTGPFGLMSIITWDYIDSVNKEYDLWNNLLPLISTRGDRCALERTIGVIFCHHSKKPIECIHGIIHNYMPWGTTFLQYLHGEVPPLPIVKVWTSR